jgi:membrane associated rhomboid family serine protease
LPSATPDICVRHSAIHPWTIGVTQRTEPIFNVPASVIAVIVVCVCVHVARVYLLTGDEDIDFLLTYAFIPARYDSQVALEGVLPGGWGADVWTFVTYAFIHGSAVHLLVNMVWLLPFGSVVARRLGSVRFLTFFAVTAAAGAAAHFAVHAGTEQPVIGASAAISGLMSAAARFAFASGGPLFRLGDDAGAYRVPAPPLATVLRDRRVIVFLGAWLALNIVFGVGAISFPGMEGQMAWEAHIGGFVAGLLLFPVFDPVAPQPAVDGKGGEDLPTALD